MHSVLAGAFKAALLALQQLVKGETSTWMQPLTGRTASKDLACVFASMYTGSTPALREKHNSIQEIIEERVSDGALATYKQVLLAVAVEEVAALLEFCGCDRDDAKTRWNTIRRLLLE